jgi:general secretion pathway protein M
MAASMKEWFEQLEPRERLLVMIAGGLVVFTLIVMLGIRPILNQSKRGHELVADKRELLAELSDVAARLGPQRGTPQANASGTSQSLVLVIDQSTRSSGLAQHLKRNQPDGASSIRLRFEDAPFDTLIQWLQGLQNQHGISVTSANIDTAAVTGRVNCNLTLSRAGT